MAGVEALLIVAVVAAVRTQVPTRSVIVTLWSTGSGFDVTAGKVSLDRGPGGAVCAYSLIVTNLDVSIWRASRRSRALVSAPDLDREQSRPLRADLNTR
jgi:hypothetical protein